MVIHQSVICYIVPLYLSSISTSSVLFPRLYTLSTHLAQSIPHIQLQMTCTFTKERTNIHQDTQGRLLSSNRQQSRRLGENAHRDESFFIFPSYPYCFHVTKTRKKDASEHSEHSEHNAEHHQAVMSSFFLSCPANVCLSPSPSLDTLDLSFLLCSVLSCYDVRTASHCLHLGLTLSCNELTRETWGIKKEGGKEVLRSTVFVYLHSLNNDKVFSIVFSLRGLN